MFHVYFSIQPNSKQLTCFECLLWLTQIRKKQSNFYIRIIQPTSTCKCIVRKIFLLPMQSCLSTTKRCKAGHMRNESCLIQIDKNINETLPLAINCSKGRHSICWHWKVRASIHWHNITNEMVCDQVRKLKGKRLKVGQRVLSKLSDSVGT